MGRTLTFFFSEIIVICLISFAFAAPIPGTSSSSLIGSDLGLYRSKEGFQIHAGSTDWIHTLSQSHSQYIKTIYRSPRANKGVQAALTVRVDQLKGKKTSVKKYVKRWRSDYLRFGFDILSAKKVKVNGNTGFLFDLVNKTSSKQLRQVVFVKNRHAVILTCRDHRRTFRQTVKTCNQIVKNFSWL